MQHCNGTCRTRAWRMRSYENTEQRPRSARQPRPRFHQSPALLRVASQHRRRAEQAEQSNRELQQQQSAQAQEIATLRQENAELLRQLEEARQNRTGGTDEGTGTGTGGTGTGSSRRRTDPGGRRRGRRDRGASRNRPIQDIEARLRHCQQMYQELAAVTEDLRGIHEAELQRGVERERLLAEALALAVEGEPPLSGEWSAESAGRVQRRAAILSTENEQLRRNVAQITAERQQLSTRLLSILLPGQAAAHASGVNYEVGRDPLIPQKREELTLLDAYAVWQSQHMRHVTARTLDHNKTLDEQALEAALAARWRLITQPPLEVRNRRQPPRWVSIGFCLDPSSERYLLRQSQRRMEEIHQRMRNTVGGAAQTDS